MELTQDSGGVTHHNDVNYGTVPCLCVSRGGGRSKKVWAYLSNALLCALSHVVCRGVSCLCKSGGGREKSGGVLCPHPCARRVNPPYATLTWHNLSPFSPSLRLPLPMCEQGPHRKSFPYAPHLTSPTFMQCGIQRGHAPWGHDSQRGVARRSRWRQRVPRPTPW